jgi:flagellar basal body-associated protein FliL
MTTTMVPPTPTPKPTSSALRYVTMRADLMPAEVISARQTVVVRKQVMLGLLVIVALLIAWFGVSWWQTTSARSDLHDAQHSGVALQKQQAQYAPLVAAQAEIGTIQGQLQKLMVGDLSWKTMVTTLRLVEPNGVTLTNVTGSVTAGAAAGVNPAVGKLVNSGVLNVTGKLQVGQLTVTGTAPTKTSIAAYADKLGTVLGLTAPLITNVTATPGDHTFTFTINLVVTADALGGRYALPATTSPATGGH